MVMLVAVLLPHVPDTLQIVQNLWKYVQHFANFKVSSS
jgi:hypothetical protein